MRIGIDVSSLCSKWDGIGTYLMDMINYINNLENNQEEVYLYSNLPTLNPLPTNARFVIREGQCENHLKWMLLYLPKMMKADELDVFWQPNYLMPIKIKGIKNVITVHDVSAYAYSSYSTPKITLLHKLFLKPSCKKADLILAISKDGANEIHKHLDVPRSKIKTIYIGKKMFKNGLDATEEEVKKCLKSYHALKKQYLLFVGTLSPRKNAEVIIKGFIEYKNSGGKSKLLVAGKVASNCENLIKTIQKSEWREDIILTGYISEKEKRILYYNASMLLFPSRIEGFGFPLLEGMQAEIPVITSNTSCMPEIAENGAIYLNNIDSYVELAQRIYDVEKMEVTERKNLIERGKKRVEYFEQMNYSRQVFDELINV